MATRQRWAWVLAALLAAVHTRRAGAHPAAASRMFGRSGTSGPPRASPTVRCSTTHAASAALAVVGAAMEKATYGRPAAAMSPAALAAAVAASAFPAQGITIPVHFHVIAYRGNPSLYESSGWNVSQAALAAQVAAASRDYAPASVAFRAASTTWHTSQLDWAKDCETQMFAIAGAVVRDPARSLNVVLCEPPTALGFAINLPTPWGFDENTPGQAVFIHYKSLPGGPLDRFNLGRTFTHEVGHWAGLSHVFSGSCDGGGDGIADTPQQKDPSGGCPAGKDTCPNVPGLDSTQNYMDYSDDACMNEFTPGQVARMQAVLLQMRPSLVAAATNPPPSPSPPVEQRNRGQRELVKRPPRKQLS